MPEFKVVTDDYRGTRFGLLTQTLMDGKTILVSDRTSVGTLYQTLKRHGFRVRQHKRPDGIVLWAERLNGED